ncbi:MAG TPA: ABC transporter substrate-binding protein [Burkholderiales bacterium]|jgi:peptide/nickel transport system substrate-binding protein|nr:ABC transporter substrate-binding protein [Burkholderiales bacterium]
MDLRHAAVATIGCAAVALAAPTALAQKSGGVLRSYNSSNPPSASIHEEATIATAMPFSAVFNNLLMFDPSKPRNGLDTIVPELAERWTWDASRTRFTVTLRRGVKWHDGKPFTAKDVQCTWHRLIGKDPDDFRKNPRAIWWRNLSEVTTNGDYEATFVLAAPQASFPALLATNLSPVYPCHVALKDMRTKPVGTGPFRFVTFDSNKTITLAKNKEYWKPGRPYLDGIQFSIVASRATRTLAFAANEFDLTFVADITPPLVGDVLARSPKAVCELAPTGVTTNLLVNRDRAPFNDENLRKAMTLAIDRQAMNDILERGKASISGAMLASPHGRWGLPKELLDSLPGYGGTPAERLVAARRIMTDLGYGPAKRLKIKVSTRDFQAFKDPAVLLVDQLNKIYFDAELEIVESSVWYNKVTRRDYSVGLNLTGSGIDDPDVTLVEGYACKSERNYTNYCNPRVEKLLAEQSQEADPSKRQQLVWQIEKILAEDAARPIILHTVAATCWHPHVKGHVLQQNSIYNNWRFEDVWLDK